MISLRRIERQSIANERVELLFYKVEQKNGKKMMKLMALKTTVPLAMVKAVLDGTIVNTFYQRLANDLIERGVESGTTVQIRANFSKSNSAIDPAYHGKHVICEVKV